MSERKDEQWLDAQLRRAINATGPEFDAEAWQRQHAEAYRALTSRTKPMPTGGGQVRWQIRWTWGRLAVAGMILVGLTILLTRALLPDRQESAPGVSAQTNSPASIVSMISLRMAYQQGGEEALNQQLDKALDQLGPRLDGLSALRVVHDLDG